MGREHNEQQTCVMVLLRVRAVKAHRDAMMNSALQSVDRSTRWADTSGLW